MEKSQLAVIFTLITIGVVGMLAASPASASTEVEWNTTVDVTRDENTSAPSTQEFNISGDDDVGDVAEVAGGGYVVAGASENTSAALGSLPTVEETDRERTDVEYTQAYLAKVNEDGDEVWTRTYATEEKPYETSIEAVIQTSDGGFMLAGSTKKFDDEERGWLIKVDHRGYEEWNQTYGSGPLTEFYDIKETNGGTFVAVGRANDGGPGGVDAIMIETNARGTEVLNETYGGEGSDEVREVVQTASGRYAMAGWTESYPAGQISDNAWLLVTGPEGDVQVNQTYGRHSSDAFYALTTTGDGDFVMAGDSVDADNNRDGWLVSTHKNGSLRWQGTYGTENEGLDDELYALEETPDGGYMLGGKRGSDNWVIKTGPNGTELYNGTIGGQSYPEVVSLTATDDDRFVALTPMDVLTPTTDAHVVKFNDTARITGDDGFDLDPPSTNISVQDNGSHDDNTTTDPHGEENESDDDGFDLDPPSTNATMMENESENDSDMDPPSTNTSVQNDTEQEDLDAGNQTDANASVEDDAGTATPFQEEGTAATIVEEETPGESSGANGTTAPTETPGSSGPGFGVVVATLAVLSVGVVARLRRGRSQRPD